MDSDATGSRQSDEQRCEEERKTPRIVGRKEQSRGFAAKIEAVMRMNAGQSQYGLLSVAVLIESDKPIVGRALVGEGIRRGWAVQGMRMNLLGPGSRVVVCEQKSLPKLHSRAAVGDRSGSVKCLKEMRNRGG